MVQKNRYAGSKDRAAIRDHVYGALRRLRSLAGKGGALRGRAILIAALREDGIDPKEIFTGGRFAPVPLEDTENAANQSLSLPEAFDIPDWLWPIWREDLGDRAEEVADALKSRAPVFLRVNCQKISPKDAVDKLRGEGVISEIHPEVRSALCVTEGQRAIQTLTVIKMVLWNCKTRQVKEALVKFLQPLSVLIWIIAPEAEEKLWLSPIILMITFTHMMLLRHA